jgi:hypothetical protein
MKYYWGDEVKEYDIGGSCSMNGYVEYVNIFIGISEWKRLTGKAGRK